MIILDTNFLMYLMKYRLAHELEEFKNELAVPEQVIQELERLSVNANLKDREAAKLSLILIKEWGIKTEKAEGKADKAIQYLAFKNKAAVGTMDKLLTKELKKGGIRILKIRQKTHIIRD